MTTGNSLGLAREFIRRANESWNTGASASTTLQYVKDAEKAIADAKARLLAHMGD